MEYENNKLYAEISNPYRLAIHQNVHVTPMPLGSICGIYKEIAPNVYQIFMNESYLEKNHELYNHELYDETLNI
ncbi:MAG: hypothetical protein K0Q73_7939, partial [Paenibacillus sp.]|nr:hypothetical protein [Paenibacillus sp.]